MEECNRGDRLKIRKRREKWNKYLQEKMEHKYLKENKDRITRMWRPVSCCCIAVQQHHDICYVQCTVSAIKAVL